MQLKRLIMLEYCKKVLNAVQDDEYLFKKELIKSISWLNDSDQIKLKEWVKNKYNYKHSDVIKEIIQTKYSFAS
jgi:hypothetical protein